MKTLYLLAVTNIGLMLASCATVNSKPATGILKDQPPISSTQSGTPKSISMLSAPPQQDVSKIIKNPLTVSLYDQENPLPQHYKILGVETVSKYNTAGIKRQKAIINDKMRKIAAAMGGDAIIGITHNDSAIIGTVIAYQEDKTPANGKLNS